MKGDKVALAAVNFNINYSSRMSVPPYRHNLGGQHSIEVLSETISISNGGGTNHYSSKTEQSQVDSGVSPSN